MHWQPVGPEPASTYWTRRAMVLLLALLVLWGLVALLTGGDDEQTLGQAAPTPSPGAAASGVPTLEPSQSPSASPSATPSPTASQGVVPCADTDLALDAKAERDSYAVGATPTLILSVRNTSDRPCRRELGQGAAELVVTSGNDRIWSSDDCRPGGDPGPKVLQPGEDDTQRLTWSATRSRPGCEGEETRIEAGTYVVSARIGSLRAQGSAFTVQR